MGAQPLPSMAFTLLTLCDDAFFAIAGALRLDPDVLRALAKRRASALAAVARGAQPEEMGQGDPWLVRLSAAVAPIAPPRWMPMANIIEDGVSLEHGARGVRSLFTSKPSEKEATRVRALGAFAVCAQTSVQSALGALGADALLLRSCLVTSLGLSTEEEQAILAEAPVPVDSIEAPPGLDPKLARAIVRGCFVAATLNGNDPRQEQAVLVLGRRVGLVAEDITAAHGDARRAVEALRAFGALSVDTIRAVLGRDAEGSRRAVATIARLTLPPEERPDASEEAGSGVAAAGGPGVGLAGKYAPDRRLREAALGLAWTAALRSDPSYARRIELGVRHDRAAAELGDEAAAGDVRRSVEVFLTEELRVAVELAPPPLPTQLPAH